MTPQTRKRLKILAIGIFISGAAVTYFLPNIGAALILHPPRRPLRTDPPEHYRAVTFDGAGVTLSGWLGKASGEHRGTVIYLHGMADNRVGGAGALESFRARGFDVIAYDSRAHGESGGEACTYGYYEKQDLQRVIDTLRPGPVILIGCSLGGAVALQTAASDMRISAVISAEAFSDLRTIVNQRAPFYFSTGNIDKSLARAEEEAGFKVDSVSPEKTAPLITAPVLIIHGAEDTDTPPDHAQRIFDSLTAPRQLILVPAAGHNQSLQGDAWTQIEHWIDSLPVRNP